MRLVLIAALLFSGCATAQTAAQSVAPIAAQLLLDLIKAKGGTVNQESAVCIPLGDDPQVAKVEEATGETYVLCWGEAE